MNGSSTAGFYPAIKMRSPNAARLILFISFLIAMGSCKKRPSDFDLFGVENTYCEDNSNFTAVWKRNTHGADFVMDPQEVEGKIAYLEGNKIVLRSLNDGAIVAEHESNDIGVTHGRISSFGDKIYFYYVPLNFMNSFVPRLFGIYDPYTHETDHIYLQTASYRNGNPVLYIQDRALFFSRSFDKDSIRQIESMVELNFSSRSFDTIYSFNYGDSATYGETFEFVTDYINTSGERIVCLRKNHPKFASHAKFIVFNLNDRKIEKTVGTGSATAYHPSIQDEKLAYIHSKNIYCYNLRSGKLEWKNALRVQDQFAGELLSGSTGNYFFLYNLNTLSALNPQNGEISWEVRLEDKFSDIFEYKDSYVIVLENKIMEVNKLSGCIIKEWHSDNNILYAENMNNLPIIFTEAHLQTLQKS